MIESLFFVPRQSEGEKRLSDTRFNSLMIPSVVNSAGELRSIIMVEVAVGLVLIKHKARRAGNEVILR